MLDVVFWMMCWGEQRLLVVASNALPLVPVTKCNKKTTPFSALKYPRSVSRAVSDAVFSFSGVIRCRGTTYIRVVEILNLILDTNKPDKATQPHQVMP